MFQIKTIFRLFVLFTIAGILSLPVVGIAQEHPTEHPKEHPTHKAELPVTKEAVAQFIEDYVAAESDLKGGYFLFYDAKTKQPLTLTLDRVHKDRLSKINANTYFVCADFKSVDGKIYDLDMFAEQTHSGFEIHDITVHKVEGKARYGWVQEGDIWIRK